ncbi:MAG: hypothetical protein CMI36_12015 [Owenweeksia sp.]|nr:hypothetical protein [Owenweeksia sp.]MBF99708.1 hypothetical protein [Owenweeksia sp.]HBF19468.1 hypothetical protein [Cryomorphaceae bacterium]HCQ15882.1 hypothetical protein [Cryomorphaceae bacterium]|tara:strand:+ start:1877 stop:2497 length:621 start_codon:yes stop_codon:yes gene_type:complete
MNGNRVFWTFIFIAGLTLTNCEKDRIISSCPPFRGSYFDIKGIASIIHHYKYTETASPPLDNNAKLNFRDYNGFILRHSVDYLSSVDKQLVATGFGQLYALSCKDNGKYGSKSEVYRVITIITLNDFNVNYKSGDTINELLTLAGYDLSIDTFLKSRDTISNNTRDLHFKLSEAPSLNPKFKVKAFIELSTGENYSKESNTVEFLD